MVKRTDSSQNWAMYDNKRNDDAPAGANVIDRLIYPNANDAEVDTGGSLMVDFLSNGFKMRGTLLFQMVQNISTWLLQNTHL